jgi:hypothetical protein
MPALNHVHIYVRRRGTQTYGCDDPDCTTKVPKEELVGKRTRCGVCKTNEFVLTRADLRLTRPRCPQCSQRADHKETREKKRLLEEMGIG